MSEEEKMNEEAEENMRAFSQLKKLFYRQKDSEMNKEGMYGEHEVVEDDESDDVGNLFSADDKTKSLHFGNGLPKVTKEFVAMRDIVQSIRDSVLNKDERGLIRKNGKLVESNVTKLNEGDTVQDGFKPNELAAIKAKFERVTSASLNAIFEEMALFKKELIAAGLLKVKSRKTARKTRKTSVKRTTKRKKK